MKTRAEIASDIAALLHDCNLTAEQKGRVFAGLADDIRWQVVAQVARRMEIAEMTSDRVSAARWAGALRESAPVTVDKARNRVLVTTMGNDFVLVWQDDRTAVPADSLDTVTVQKNHDWQWYIAGPTRGGHAVLSDPLRVVAS